MKTNHQIILIICLGVLAANAQQFPDGMCPVAPQSHQCSKIVPY